MTRVKSDPNRHSHPSVPFCSVFWLQNCSKSPKKKKKKKEKKESLGIQKKNKMRSKMIKRNKKRLIKKVADYLLSDPYLYAPLFSPSMPHFPASKRFVSSFVSGMRMEGDMKRRDKILLEKIGEYLRCDFFAPRQVTARGLAKYIKIVKMEVSTRKLRKNNESTVQSSNVTVEDQFSEDDIPEISAADDREKLLHRETLKHVVYQTCRSSSVSGKGLPDSRIRKLLID